MFCMYNQNPISTTKKKRKKQKTLKMMRYNKTELTNKGKTQIYIVAKRSLISVTDGMVSLG